MNTPISYFDFTHKGFKFVADVYLDENTPSPWLAEDGHGPVSGWTTAPKRPGDLVLAKQGQECRYYDAQAAAVIARRDAWGLDEQAKAALAVKLGRAPSQREIWAEAVRLDFEHLKGFCDGKWEYVGVAVRVLDASGNPVGGEFDNALWGIASHRESYREEVARELADGLLPKGMITHSLADELAALGQRLHDEADAEQERGEGQGAMRDMVDDLQQMAATLRGEVEA